MDMNSYLALYLTKEFMKTYNDSLSSRGCNDYELENTSEMRELYYKACKWNGDDDEDIVLPDEGAKKINCMDFQVVGYLVYCLEEMLGECVGEGGKNEKNREHLGAPTFMCKWWKQQTEHLNTLITARYQANHHGSISILDDMIADKKRDMNQMRDFVLDETGFNIETEDKEGQDALEIKYREGLSDGYASCIAARDCDTGLVIISQGLLNNFLYWAKKAENTLRFVKNQKLDVADNPLKEFEDARHAVKDVYEREKYVHVSEQAEEECNKDTILEE